MKTELTGGLALLALAGAYFWATERIPNSMLDDDFGPRGLPVILAGLLAFLAIILVLRALVGMRTPAKDAVANDEEGGDDKEHASTFPRAIGFLLVSFGYVLVLPYIGYPIAIALLIAAVAFYEGAQRNWKIPATAVFGGLLFWLLFHQLLGVPQPSGLLF